MQKIDLVELIYQTAGEFNEKFEAKELTIVTKLPKTEVMILADGRQLYRVIENLYNNVAKYALKNKSLCGCACTGGKSDIFHQKCFGAFPLRWKTVMREI